MSESELFATFRAGLDAHGGLGRDATDEYPGVRALHLLTGDERRAAEDLLIARLATNDGRAAQALADAHCTRAIPALRDRIGPGVPPTMRIFAARALRRLGDDSGRDVGPALLGDPSVAAQDRSRAAALITEFPRPDREALLHAAEHDRDRLVRTSATAAVRDIVGPGGEGETVGSIAGRLASRLRAIRGPAATELRAILDALDHGADAADLGLLWRPDPEAEPLRGFVAAVTGGIDPDGPDYPADVVTGLTGRERRLAEDLLLIYLPHDPRAARAAARIGLIDAVPALRDLATDPDPALSAAAREALRTLATT